MKKRTFVLLLLLIATIIYLLVSISLKNLNNKSFYNKEKAISLVKNTFPQYKIVKQFDTGIDLEGFVLEDKKNSHKRTVTFTTKDGNVVVNGELITWDKAHKKPTSMNKLYIDYFNSDINAKKLYSDILKNYKYIEQGSKDAKHKIYAIISPNSAESKTLFNATQNAIKSDTLAVRWIIISSNNRDDSQVIDKIYNAKNSLDELYKYENKQSYSNTNKNNFKDNILDKYKPPLIIYKNSENVIKIAGGNKMPLTAAKIAEKSNIKKLDELLFLTSNQF